MLPGLSVSGLLGSDQTSSAEACLVIFRPA